MYEIFRFEISHRFKSPVTWLFFIAVTFVSLFAIDFIYEGRLVPIKENAPYVVAVSMSVFSSFLMMLCSLIMGMSVLKDYQYNMHSLIFVTPISKSDYLIGRFLGSFCVLLLVTSGLFLGVLLSEFLPWRDAGNMLPFNLRTYLLPYLFIIIPTMFFSGIVFFMSGALSRKLVVVYTQGVLFLMLYLLSLVLSRGFGNQILWSQIIDPFNFQTIKIIIQDWTINERNASQLIYTTYILYNRVFWVVIGIISFTIGYKRFNFNAHLEGNAVKYNSNKAKRKDFNFEVKEQITLPKITISNSLGSNVIQIWHVCKFQFFTIFKEPLFVTLVVSGIVTVLINSIDLETKFGIDNYPLTYLVVEQLNELTLVFFMMILVFYSGEIIWKERDVKVNKITDAFQISEFVRIVGKFGALIFVYLLLMAAMILVGMIFQTLNIFFDFNIKVYFMSLVVQNLPFLIMYSVLSMFIHVVVNNKMLGYVVFIIFFLARIALEMLGYGHVLYLFAAGSLGMYSDLNGYGHSILPFVCFVIYWMAFSFLLLILSLTLTLRGEELTLMKRIKLIPFRLTISLKRMVIFTSALFAGFGGFIFYNTNVINDFSFPSTESEMRSEYEKLFKEKEELPQPKIVDVTLELDLCPQSRCYSAKGIYKLVNKDTIGINKIIVQAYPNSRIELNYVYFDREATLDYFHKDYKIFIYHLNKMLLPNDSLILSFSQTYTSKGFVQDDNNNMLYNGTFINNDQFPTIGYNDNIELEDNGDRIKYGLEEIIRFNDINNSNELCISTNGDDADFIKFEATISTSANQIAVAPGRLVDSWNSNNRKYFHYKMQAPMINFYDVVSADYKVLKSQWVSNSQRPVALEVYYHEGHDTNIERMMKGMKASFSYYTDAFGEYYYDHARIMEIPRYKQFAQSYPGTIPFSESLGFVMDIKDSVDIDIAFFITAHEIAHQWWGLKLLTANVEGHDFVLESLSQYSALMVLQKEYGIKITQQFIKDEMKRYFQKRSWAKENEKPLSHVDDQDHVYYDKGAVNLYALQTVLGEDKMNQAIKSFYDDWSVVNVLEVEGRYATSLDLISYLETALPDSLNYLIDDLFKDVVFYDNKIDSVNIREQGHSFLVDIKLSLEKSKVDSSGNIAIQKGSEYFEVAFYFEDDDGIEVLSHIERKELRLNESQVQFTLCFKPSKVILDPNLKLLDKKLYDNNFEILE